MPIDTDLYRAAVAAASGLALYVKDNGSNFVAGPFKSGDKVKITQAPGVTPNTKPMAGVIK